jgi:hypothetical protein
MVRRALAAVAVACAGCQWILSIDPNVNVLDGGPGGACASSGAIVCDDFEEGTIDAQRWQRVTQTGATVAVDSTRAHSGSFALHANAAAVSAPGSANDVSGYVEHQGALPADVFVRFWAFVPSAGALPSKSEILAQLVDATGLGMQLDVNSGYLALTSWANSPELDLTSGTQLSPDAWHCVEWEANQGPPGQTAVWIDGNAVGDLGVPVTAPAYVEVQLGIGFFKPPAQPPFELWIDDLVVQGSRVGCD